MRRRRATVQYAPLTSLLDVLFILVFASLIHGAALERKAAEAEGRVAEGRLAPPAVGQKLAAAPVPPLDPVAAALRAADELRRAALAQLMTGLEGRRPVVARVGRDGLLRALERREAGGVMAIPLSIPLVERVPDPDVALIYLGDRRAGLRLCSLVRLHLGSPDLSDTLVLVAPDAPLDQLSVALARGLQRDAERCLPDQRGVAIIVDPRAATAGSARQEGGTP